MKKKLKSDSPLRAATCSRSSIVEFIRRYNRWRRGDESLTMESPKAIGEAMDAVCDILDQHANEIQGWGNKWECAVEMAARAELERDEARRMWTIYQDKCAELREKYATHHAEADRLTLEITAAKCTLAKWIEWARMHGHLDHAAGIADDSRRLISSENDRDLAPPP